MTRNVVLITYDSLRADHCTPWGYERNTTPTLDSLADSGVVFENAIAPASRTNPSMAGAFTGEPLVVRDRVAVPDHARYHLQRHGTLAEALSEAGYATGAFCPNAYASRYYGFDHGFDHYEDFLFDNGIYRELFDKHLGDSGVFTALRNARNLLRRQEAFKTWDTYIEAVQTWVDDQDEPFFLWVFSLDTHFPYLTPRAYRQWSGLVDQYYYNWRCNKLIDRFDVDLSEREKRKIIDIYDDSIYFGDRLLDALQERLAAYDPVFVVHADHGEAFSEHDVYGHFYPSLYEENIHVPLVVDDGTESGTVEHPVSLTDLPEIVERAAGCVDGNVTDVTHDWVIATDYDGRNDRNLKAIRTRELKYVLGRTGDREHRELYKLDTDRTEQRNLAGEDAPADELLGQVADRRMRHERELLSITEAVQNIDK